MREFLMSLGCLAVMSGLLAGCGQGVPQLTGEQMKAFPGYARVRRVLLMREPWSIENGLLTPTLKIKRVQVTRRFESEIGELYRGH